MKLNSVSGIVCFVQDIEKTEAFYKGLGFVIDKKETNRVLVQLNWFWIDFRQLDKEPDKELTQDVKLPSKSAGIYTFINVDNVDEYCDELIADGYNPESRPNNTPWGNRECILHDPDGYRLVFFQKK